ncbi:MAG: hypothetical protein JWN52_2651 [Actinomycetia bacterium]|nr:hypothetical protein [Actinomycetes bacterium]
MHAMQYEITLPADYDMKIIRHRVATKGHLLDAFPGLGEHAAPETAGTRYEVLHPSAPHLGELEVGRHW